MNLIANLITLFYFIVNPGRYQYHTYMQSRIFHEI